MTICIFAYSLHATIRTIADTVFVECARRWVKSGHRLVIMTHEAGKAFCVANGIGPSMIYVMPMSGFDRLGYRESIQKKSHAALYYFHENTIPSCDAYYAISFFLSDMIPGMIAIWRYPKAKLIVGFFESLKLAYFSDLKRSIFSAVWLHIHEWIATLGIIYQKAIVLLMNVETRDQLIHRHKLTYDSAYVIGGGIDAKSYLSIPEQPRIYEAVFSGNLSPGYAVDELILIWQQVLTRHHEWKLGIIGDGVSMDTLKQHVIRSRIEKNVVFLGTLTGIQKIMALKSATVFISSARLGESAMYALEAMASGVPVVMYDVVGRQLPIGMIRVPIGDTVRFSYAIETTIIDKVKHDQLSSEALAFAMTNDWDIKAGEVLKLLSV